MRHLFIAFLATLSVPAARAQWTVYDPAVHAQQIISTAQEVAKFVEMIGNQVRQIDELREQVSTLHHYVDLFGDPGSVLPVSSTALGMDLVKVEVGVRLDEITAAVDPLAAMAYDAGGLFQKVGEEFTTPRGDKVKRSAVVYRPVAAVQDLTDNFLKVAKDVGARRVALKLEIARTTEALAKATTDAAVQKLTGTLTGLEAALQGVEQELAQATSQAVVQDIATRADAVRQAAARGEEIHAEFTEASAKIGASFRLLTAPVAFPLR